MSLGDLDELVQSCNDHEARHVITEAVLCYRSGAYRASIVATWIAVVFDLIAKIREIALLGDADAKKITSELAAWQPLIEKGDLAMIKKSLDLEREIVNIANERFGFFDGLQVLDLTRLRDDRNRCAHPTFQGGEQPYTPSSELARSHLVHAVKHVLSQPPVQGKAATAQILRSVRSSYFPTDVTAAIIQFRSGGLDRPRDALVRSVADHLTFGFFEGGTELKGRPQTAVALKALLEMHPGQAEHRIRRAINIICRRLPDEDLNSIVDLHGYLPATWGFLEVDNRQKLNEFVRQLPDKQASLVLPVALQIDGLKTSSGTRLSTLASREVGEILKQNQNAIVVARAVDLYCSSTSWDQANSIYERAIEPILDKLEQDQMRRILAAPQVEKADLNGAHSFSGFTRHIYETERLPKIEIQALLTENGMKHIADRLAVEDDFPF